MNRFAAEGAGTLLLTLAVGMTSDPVAIGAVLIALIYVCVHKSDAHFNPAVSIAAWTRGKISAEELLIYLGGQFSGAVIAAGISLWIAGTTYFSTPDPATGIFQFIAVEFIFSLLLIVVYITMIYPATRRRNPVFGIIIGFVFAGCLMISQPIAGTGLNPAIAAAYAFIDYLNMGDSYQYLAIYMLAPATAGLIAAVIHKWLIGGD